MKNELSAEEHALSYSEAITVYSYVCKYKYDLEFQKIFTNW